MLAPTFLETISYLWSSSSPLRFCSSVIWLFFLSWEEPEAHAWFWMWGHRRSIQDHIHTEIYTGFCVLYGVMWEHFALSSIPSSTKTSFKQWVYTHQWLLADSFTLAFRILQWTVSSPGTVSIPLTQFVLNLVVVFFFIMVICDSFLDVGLNFLECFKYTLTCSSCLF